MPSIFLIGKRYCVVALPVRQKKLSAETHIRSFRMTGSNLLSLEISMGWHRVAVLTLATDHVKTLVSERAVVGGIAWDPSDDNIIFGAILTGSSRLWRISASGGTPRPLGVGEDGWAPSVSEKTHRLTYAQGAGDTNIWRIRFGKDKVETRTPLIASTRQEVQPELSPDESKVVFSSDRSGTVEIWVSDSDGNNPMQVTHLGTFNTGRPHWSPDGARIAFESGARGKPDVYSVSLDGADPRRLTDDNFEDSAPTWSVDGKWIYYQSNRSGQIQIWRLSSQGDRAVQLTTSGGLGPQSPARTASTCTTSIALQTMRNLGDGPTGRHRAKGSQSARYR